MLRLLSLLALSLVALAQNPLPPQQFIDLGVCPLESGQVIHECRFGYRTLGTLNPQRSNAVLITTWASGTTEQLVPAYSAMIDPARDYVIFMDAWSNGGSSSPSNSKSQPHMHFPQYTMHDLVRAEHRVITEKLGIAHLHAIMGSSMGGMQTFEWLADYPDMMDYAVPIQGTPKQTPYNMVTWQAHLDGVMGAADFHNGDYTAPPAASLRTEFGDILLTSPDAFNREHAKEDVLAKLRADSQKPGQDANDMIRQTQSMMSIHVLDAAGRSKAKTLVIVDTRDLTVNPESAIEWANRSGAKLLKYDSDCGHLASACLGGEIAKQVRDFLNSR